MPAIAAVTAAAFLDAPHSSHTEHHIVDALRRTCALTLSLVAERDGVVLGHLALSPVSIADGAAHWFGLGPLSVQPAHQRRGIGASLMHAAIAALRQRGAGGCVVLGEPGYYGRFGFRATPELILPDVPPAYFQALHLGPAQPRGIVAYPAAFAATG